MSDMFSRRQQMGAPSSRLCLHTVGKSESPPLPPTHLQQRFLVREQGEPLQPQVQPPTGCVTENKPLWGRGRKGELRDGDGLPTTWGLHSFEIRGNG